MSRFVSATAVMAVGLAVGAPALKGPATGRASVEGEWLVESATYDGWTDTDGGGGGRYVFRADGTWSYFGKDGKEHGGVQRDYRADPAANPPSLDLMYGKSRPGRRTESGIYELDGDTLTVCYRVGPGDRPSRFESSEGGHLMLIKLRRVKPQG